MKNCLMLVAVLACAVGLANAKTLRWSSSNDFVTADPHAQNAGINDVFGDRPNAVHLKPVRPEVSKGLPA